MGQVVVSRRRWAALVVLSLHLLAAASALVHQIVVRHVACEHGALVHAGEHARAVVDALAVVAVGVDDDHDDDHCSAAAPPPPATPAVTAGPLLVPLVMHCPCDRAGLQAAGAVVALELLRLAPKGSPPRTSVGPLPART